MKHLSLTNRCMIEQYIAYGYSFREIAGELGYQPSTISREVKNEHTEEEITMIRNMRHRNPDLELTELWSRLKKRGYTRRPESA